DRVTFTGRLSHRLVPSYLDACDILVSPHVPMEDGSDFFGSPTKLFEYMAMAKPIVASRLGQIADVIEDGKNGYLIEPANVAMLVEVLTKLSAKPSDCKVLGAQAREDVIANYTWKRNAGRVLEAYLAHK
ncbi:MAG: group 1 glycosyl transferase, partial [bacterium]